MLNRKSLALLFVASVFQFSLADPHGQEGHVDPDSKIRFKSNEQANNPQQTRQAPLHDSKHVHDKDHIKDHLQDVANVKEDDLNDSNLQFHYFKLHDYDNNDKLDGIELANAMTHYHDEETGEKAEDYTEDELGSMVDQILDEDDMDRDGYIDYPEFIASQQRE